MDGFIFSGGWVIYRVEAGNMYLKKRFIYEISIFLYILNILIYAINTWMHFMCHEMYKKKKIKHI